MHYGNPNGCHCEPAPRHRCANPRAWEINQHPAFDVPLTGDTAVIFCHFNPAGFNRPRWNMGAFLDWLYSDRIPVFGAELAYHGQDFQLPSTPRVARFRAGLEGMLFAKEPLLNLAEKIVPPQFTKIIALDADVIIRGRDWFKRCREALAFQKILQPFSVCHWIAEHGGEGRLPKISTAYAYQNQRRDWHEIKKYHPGFGAAVQRSFFKTCGGFYRCGILGSGDTALMLAAAGGIDLPHFYSSHAPAAMVEPRRAWGHRVAEWSGRTLGALPFDVDHLWHGAQHQRQYEERFQLVAHHDPATDFITRPDGLKVWSPYAMTHKAQMVQSVINYFPTRQEDGISPC